MRTNLLGSGWNEQTRSERLTGWMCQCGNTFDTSERVDRMGHVDVLSGRETTGSLKNLQVDGIVEKTRDQVQLHCTNDLKHNHVELRIFIHHHPVELGFDNTLCLCGGRPFLSRFQHHTRVIPCKLNPFLVENVIELLLANGIAPVLAKKSFQGLNTD